MLKSRFDFKNENSFETTISKSMTFVSRLSAPDASEARKKRIKLFVLYALFTRFRGIWRTLM